MKRLFALAFVIILSGLLGGCGRGQNSHQTKQAQALEPGFEMVEQGRFEDAIQYFEGVYETKPTDDALKAWASVYVARAGLKISTLYKAYLSFPKGTSASADSNQDNILLQIQAYQKSLEQIPYIKGDARTDLKTAATILQVRDSQSVRLFRSFINLVLLRSTFSDGNQVLLNADVKVDLQQGLKVVCKLEWKKLRSWISIWTTYGLELKKDLDFAYPSKRKDWLQGQKFFTDARKLSTTLVRTCDP